MLGGIIANVVGDVIKSVVDSDNNREVAIRQSKDQRNVAIAQTIVQGAVTAYGIYEQSRQNRISATPKNQQIQTIEATEDIPQLPAGNQPVYDIIYNTVWANKNKGEMGATLVEVNTGERVNVAYRMQNIGGKKYNVSFNVNNEGWENAGVVDWNRMSMADLSGVIDPFFAEIVSIVMQK